MLESDNTETGPRHRVRESDRKCGVGRGYYRGTDSCVMGCHMEVDTNRIHGEMVRHTAEDKVWVDGGSASTAEGPARC